MYASIACLSYRDLISNKDAASIDHTPHAHPASPTHELPAGFGSSPSFSSYRQQAQQHGPLGKAGKSGGIGDRSGHSLGPVTPAKGEYFDRNELPARFRRRPLDIAEIDAIETGGATLVC
jgi:small subunit ribosomal protein YMR-31